VEPPLSVTSILLQQETLDIEHHTYCLLDTMPAEIFLLLVFRWSRWNTIFWIQAENSREVYEQYASV